VLLTGTYRDDLLSLTVGGAIYLSTSGTLTQVAPSATEVRTWQESHNGDLAGPWLSVATLRRVEAALHSDPGQTALGPV